MRLVVKCIKGFFALTFALLTLSFIINGIKKLNLWYALFAIASAILCYIFISKSDDNKKSKNKTKSESLSQCDVTNKILNQTDFSNCKTINEMSEMSRLRSDLLYEERETRIKKFDPKKVEIAEKPCAELSSTEKYFLKSMENQSITSPTIYAYWTYEYSINFNEIMTKLISNEYLTISTPKEKVTHLKVQELKNILEHFSLPTFGKKSELISRINSNIAESDLINFIPNSPELYVLTLKGKAAVKNLPKSATKNLEFEDECIKLIIEGDVDGAYKTICKNEIQKKSPRGLGINWSSELEKGLSDFRIKLYTDFLNLDISKNLPLSLSDYETEFKACCIFGIMLGIAVDSIVKTFFRITNCTENKPVVTSIMQKYQFEIMEHAQKQAFIN